MNEHINVGVSIHDMHMTYVDDVFVQEAVDTFLVVANEIFVTLRLEP
jgi:hypothetical protein